MTIKKQTIKKDERKVNVMNEKRKMNGKEWQLERIAKYPLPIKGNMIIMDNLEAGVLRIFQPVTDDPAYVQFSDNMVCIMGANLIGEMTINILMGENSVSLQNLFCQDGYYELSEVMLFQLCRFAEFYDFEIKDNKA